jgi:hypothetical protein
MLWFEVVVDVVVVVPFDLLVPRDVACLIVRIGILGTSNDLSAMGLKKTGCRARKKFGRLAESMKQ